MNSNFSQMTLKFAQQLLDGVNGAIVKERLRYTYADGTRTEPRPISSLHSEMTNVRKAVSCRGLRSADYDPSTLRELAVSEPDIAAFLSAPIGVQMAIQESHATKPTWSHEAELALASLQLQSRTMESFKLSHEEVIELKRQQEAAVVAKNDNPITVPDYVLKAVTTMLENATPDQSYASLILPLLLVTGRRTAELCNGKSIFAPAPEGEMYAVFTGQLKKKEGTATPYTIPLLVPYRTFQHAWMALRHKQSEPSSYSNIAAGSLSNKQINHRFSKTLDRALNPGHWYQSKKNKPKPSLITGLPLGLHAHDLRCIYVALVFHCYRCPASFLRTIMKVLGHETMKDSMPYATVRIEGEGWRGAFGSLTV